MTPPAQQVHRVAIGGLGAIGGWLAERLDQGIPGLKLAAVSARDADKARRRMAAFQDPVPVVRLSALTDHADVVVECAPAAHFDEVAEPAVEAGGFWCRRASGRCSPDPT